MTSIVSAIPGRIRVRLPQLPQLRNAARLERLRALLAADADIREVEINPAAGSLLLRYDPAVVAPERMEALVDAAVDDELAAPRPDTAEIRLSRLNRHAKRGMLLSLALSLAFAAAGKKRWHALSGGLFLAGLGLHLAIHRRRLLR